MKKYHENKEARERIAQSIQDAKPGHRYGGRGRRAWHRGSSGVFVYGAGGLAIEQHSRFWHGADDTCAMIRFFENGVCKHEEPVTEENLAWYKSL